VAEKKTSNKTPKKLIEKGLWIDEVEGSEEEKLERARRDVLEDYMPYIIIILCVVILRTFIATPIRVNGSSMDDTLKNGEILVLNKLALRARGISRWNIIVAKLDGNYLIKRVVALPGETVRYEDGVLYIDGEKIDDDFSLTLTEDFEEFKVEAGKYFVMGDNRFVSQDSRMIGSIDRKDIIGKTNIVLFPFGRFGIVE